ncbi:MAG: regulatory protein RecX [Lentisphaeria bacterium]|nr:regulatory protein RecX [Lentisphaeria bacterium]
MVPPRCSALEKAMRILSVAAKSGKELKDKLLKSGYGPTEAEAAVEECIRRGYVNDALLAQDFAACSIDRGSGAVKVRQKLLRRGLPRELVEQAIEENREREPDSARSVLAAKWKSLSRETDPYKKRAKAFRFLVGRGFPPGLAGELIDEITSSAGADE